MDALDSAKSKIVGHIAYEHLPKRDTDPLWNDIRGECDLTLNELGALKNNICSQAHCPSDVPREQDTFDEFLESLTPFVDINDSKALGSYLQDHDRILKSLKLPLPKKIDISRSVLRDSIFHSEIFNVNSHGQECHFLAQQIETFDTLKNVSSSSANIISEENVLISCTPITGQLWSLLAGHHPLDAFDIQYTYNKKDVSGFTHRLKPPDECVYCDHFLIAKGEHTDKYIREATKELISKLPEYDEVEYGKDIKFLPVYASARNQICFYLLDVQKKTFSLISSCSLTIATHRAKAVQISINIFRYFQTMKSAIPAHALPLFLSVDKGKILFLTNHVIKKRRLGQDTCPMELYTLLQEHPIPYGIQVLELHRDQISLAPKGIRIDRDANQVSVNVSECDGLEEFKIAMRCVLRCISALHQAGFVHRDLRWPNMIKIVQEDKFKSVRFVVIDFESAAHNNQPIPGSDYLHSEICPAGRRFVFGHDLRCLGDMMDVFRAAKRVGLGVNGENLLLSFRHCPLDCPANHAEAFLVHPFFTGLDF